MGGLPTSTVNGLAVNASNPRVMYVGMRDGIFRSEDAGESWKPVANGPKNVAAVTVNPKRPEQVVAATMEGAIFHSDDAGSTWRRRGP